jgi:hypothetical protein
MALRFRSRSWYSVPITRDEEKGAVESELSVALAWTTSAIYKDFRFSSTFDLLPSRSTPGQAKSQTLRLIDSYAVAILPEPVHGSPAAQSK